MGLIIGIIVVVILTTIVFIDLYRTEINNED
jgi:hypothetical protein